MDEVEAAVERDDAIEVLTCNEPSVQVFLRCQMQYVGGASGVACVGVAALEVGAVLQLLGTSRDACAQLLDDVLLMGREAAQCINARIKRSTGD